MRRSRSHNNRRPVTPRASGAGTRSFREVTQARPVDAGPPARNVSSTSCTIEPRSIGCSSMISSGTSTGSTCSTDLHEERVRAARPQFEPSRRDGALGVERAHGAQRLAEAGQVAVEAGERVARTRLDEIATRARPARASGPTTRSRARHARRARGGWPGTRRCATPCAYEATASDATRGSVSSRNRDGTCSVLRRRSPRGQVAARVCGRGERRQHRAFVVVDPLRAQS